MESDNPRCKWIFQWEEAPSLFLSFGQCEERALPLEDFCAEHLIEDIANHDRLEILLHTEPL